MGVTKRSDAETLRQLIRTFIRCFGLLDQSRTPCGLPMTVSDAHALVELLLSPGLEPLELSRRLGLSKSAVSRLLLRLKRRGQITQKSDQSDGRAFNLHLTEKGKRTANLINRESITLFGSILSRIREDDAKRILDSLPLLIQAIREPGSDSDSR
jgi:DNA-binding MarR family transcriptional regulator